MQQFLSLAPPPVGVLFDAAFDRIGDLLTVSLLYGIDGKDEMRMNSITVSRPDFAAAQYCDVVRRFYSSRMSGFGVAFPVGLPEGKPRSTAAYETLMAKKAEDGSQPYKSTILNFNDTADPATVLRNALSASHPKNTIFVASGPFTNLASLLSLGGAKEMIAENSRYLVMAAGNFAHGEPDPHVAADVKSAQKVLEQWPTPVYLCGLEMGDSLRYPGASIESDFGWSKAHPVADAYRAFQPMPYDAPASGMAAALYAIRPTKGYFKLSEPGVFRVSASGAIEHTPSPQGKHQLLLRDEARTAEIVKVFTELASAQPVVRVRRIPKAANNEDAPPKKQ